jgi:hypothetical protein
MLCIERIFGRAAATAFDISFRGDMLWRVFAIEINVSKVRIGRVIRPAAGDDCGKMVQYFRPFAAPSGATAAEKLIYIAAEGNEAECKPER